MDYLIVTHGELSFKKFDFYVIGIILKKVYQSIFVGNIHITNSLKLIHFTKKNKWDIKQILKEDMEKPIIKEWGENINAFVVFKNKKDIEKYKTDLFFYLLNFLDNTDIQIKHKYIKSLKNLKDVHIHFY